MGIEELIIRASEHEGMKQGLAKGEAERNRIETELRARIAELEQIISKNKYKG